MNILLINHYAGSVYRGMEFRPYYMAREWVKLGHKVTILAADYSHLRKVNPQIEKDFTEETVDGITYVWVKTNPYQGNRLGRVRNVLAFTRKVKRASDWLAKKYQPEAVIASSTYPMDIYPADQIAKAAGARLYFEIHDLWPLTQIIIWGMGEKNPFIRYLQKAEDYAFGHVNRVISILPDADRHIKERGFDTPYAYIPNGVITEEGEQHDSSEPQVLELKRLRDEGHFVVAYTGNHSEANDLGAFIEASRRFAGEDKVKFVLVGKGNVKPDLIKQSEECGAEHVLFFDPVPKEAMQALLDQTDAVFMGLKKSRLFHYGVSPNKLYDYMLAARPVIYAVEASNDPVSEAGCGLTIPASDPDAIAAAVRELMTLSEEARSEMGARGKAYVLENHQYSALAEKFIASLQD